MRSLTMAVALASTLAAAACDSTDPGVPPIERAASVVSPNGPEGAAVIELTGGTLHSVAAADDATEVFSSTSGNLTRVVLVRATPGPLRFTLRLRDGSQLPTASVVEVAAPDNALRGSLAGYRVEF